MRRSQVCKHQVCDYCGGRFGMVAHRWWGDKFCKRTCKNAYLRENHQTLSGWVIPQFFCAGGACLAAAVAVVVRTLLLASANAAPGEERPAAGASLELNKEDGTLYIDWSGPIVAGMADDLRAFEPSGPLPRLGWWSGRGGRPCHRGPQRDQATPSARDRGAPRQPVGVNRHTDLPPGRGASCGAGKRLDLPRSRPTAGKRPAANRHGGDVAGVSQKLPPPRGLKPVAQKKRAPEAKPWQTGGESTTGERGRISQSPG